MARLPVVLVLFAFVTGCSIGGGAPIRAGVPTQVTGSPAQPPRSSTTPEIRIDVVAQGLEHVWDIGFLPTGGAVITERPARLRFLPSPTPATPAAPVAAAPRG